MYRFYFDDKFQKSALHEMAKAALDRDYIPEGGLTIGCARVGDVCFDINLRDYRNETGDSDDIYLACDLYVGGIDDGYGYSAEDALLTGNYIYKHQVPAEELYPYTYAEDCTCGGHLAEYIGADFDELVDALENEMNDALNIYAQRSPDNRKLLAEAINRPFHFW